MLNQVMQAYARDIHATTKMQVLRYQATTTTTTTAQRSSPSLQFHFSASRTSKNAKHLFVRIYDSRNQMVAQLEKEGVSEGAQAITWDGTSRDGTVASKDDYRVEVIAYDKHGSQTNFLKHDRLRRSLDIRSFSSTPVLRSGVRFWHVSRKSTTLWCCI